MIPVSIETCRQRPLSGREPVKTWNWQQGGNDDNSLGPSQLTHETWGLGEGKLAHFEAAIRGRGVSAVTHMFDSDISVQTSSHMTSSMFFSLDQRIRAIVRTTRVELACHTSALHDFRVIATESQQTRQSGSMHWLKNRTQLIDFDVNQVLGGRQVGSFSSWVV